MKPIAIETVQMTQDNLPTVAATAPMENSTRGGTPLATQNAPVQSMPRSRPVLAPVSTIATSAVELMDILVDALRAEFNGVEATPSESGRIAIFKTNGAVHRRS